MESPIQKFEKAHKKKISLMRALLECLDQERENLIHVDVKGLWGVMERKKKVLTSIQETEQEIAGCRAEDSELEINARSSFNTFNREIARLKQEIRARVKENISFIEETLSFFDEIVSIFAAGGKQEYSYGQLLQRQRPAQSILYESEV